MTSAAITAAVIIAECGQMTSPLNADQWERGRDHRQSATCSRIRSKQRKVGNPAVYGY